MEILKKHSITILCVLSIIFLALPVSQVISSYELFGQPAGEAKVSITGFGALKSSVWAYLLLFGPAVLIAMNYIKQLTPYKGLLAIAVPILCLCFLILLVVQSKAFSVSASNSVGSAEIELKLGVGAVLLGLSHLGTIVAGAVTYHNFTLDKAGLEKLKSSAGEMINAAKEKVSAVAHDASHTSETAQVGGEETIKTSAPVMSTQQKKVNTQRVDEILALIEKLASMKDAGILTDEEFADKKKQLLEEI